MDKGKTKIKRKPNWKFYTLIIALTGLIAALIFTLCHYGFSSWLPSILFPTILSAVVSMGVSLWFTMKSEKDRLIEELSKEIDGLQSHMMRLTRTLYEIAQNPLYSSTLKKQILHSEFLYMPDMYRIMEYYQHLWDLCKTNRDKMISEMQSWNDKSGSDGFISNFELRVPILVEYIAEVIDCTLKVQEQFEQDFKGAPKKPIQDQLIFSVGKKQ